MREVFIIGVHTTKFTKHLDKSIKDLTALAVNGALEDSGADKKLIESAFFSNSGWGMRSWQHTIRGQVALRPLGIDAIPIVNVENACAGGSTALHSAYKDVASGATELSLAVGAEKVYAENKLAVFAGFISGMDTEAILDYMDRMKEFAPPPTTDSLPKEDKGAGHGKKKGKKKSLRGKINEWWDMFAVFVQLGETMGYDTVKKLAGANQGDHSPFMDVYGYAARKHMEKYGSTQAQLAAIASKNHWHSSMNVNAQYTFEVSVEQALADRVVSWPLTRAMCAPVGDGAAAAIVASGDMMEKLGVSSRAAKVRASVLVSGRTREWDDEDIAVRASRLAYEKAGLGPADINLAEVHDATAFGELHQSESLGFFAKGEGGAMAEAGETKIGGKIPINTSGGLLSRGHPIGASGLAQVHELVTQLRGEAGKRQVDGAKIAMAENGGGALGNEEAAMGIHIIESP